ncbi:hypothetical protein P9112_008960 [Eukaryota sp. TZLM1-RC]
MSTVKSGAQSDSGSTLFRDMVTHNMFAMFRRLNKCFGRHVLLAQIAFSLELLQLIGLVINPFLEPWHWSVDPRHFLVNLYFPSFFSDTSFSLFSHRTVFFILSSTIVTLLASLGLCFYSTVKEIPKAIIFRFCRLLFEIVAGPLFLPAVIHFMTYLTCSDVGTFSKFSTSQCYSTEALVLRIPAVLLLLITIVLKFAQHFALFDLSPYSRKVFARPHSRWLCYFTLVRIIIVFALITLDHIKYIFWVLYPFLALTCLIYLLSTHPFFSSRTNTRVAGGLGVWFGCSLLWVGKQVAFEVWGVEFDAVFVMSSFLTISVVFAVGFYFLEVWLYSRSLKLLPRLNLELLENDTDLDDMDIIVPKVKSPFHCELLSRFLLTHRRPTQTYLIVAKNLWESCLEEFPESSEALVLKAHFEVVFLKDALNALVSLNSVSTADLEVSVSWKYLSFYLFQECDYLRRFQNTGQSLDSGSFVQIQRQLNDTKDSVQECLDHLKAFWTHLLSENVNLQQLPVLTQRIYSTRTECDESFKKLLMNGKGNRDILLAYIDFVKDVVQDDELLTNLQTQYELLDTDSQQSSSYDGKSSRNLSESGSISGTRSVRSTTHKRRRKRKKKLLNLNDTLSDSASTAESSISKLFRSIIIATLIIFGLSLAAFIAVSAALESIQEATRQFYEADHLGFTVNKLGFDVLLANVLGGEYNNEVGIPNVELGQVQGDIRRTAEHLMLHIRRLYLGSSFSQSVRGDTEVCPGITDSTNVNAMASTPLRNVFVDSSLSATSSSISVPPLTETTITSLWQLILQYTRSAIGTVEVELNGHGEDLLLSFQSTLDFVMLNQFSLSDMIVRLWNRLEANNYEFITTINTVGVAVGFSSFAMLLGIGLLMFKRAFSFISSERNYILNLFLYIPKDAIERILADPKFHAGKERKVTKAAVAESDESEFSDSETDGGLSDQKTKPQNNFVEQPIESGVGPDSTLNIMLNTLEDKGEDYLVNLTSPESPSVDKTSKTNGIMVTYIVVSLSVLTALVFGGAILFFILRESIETLQETSFESVEYLSMVQELVVLQRQASNFVLRFAQQSDLQSFDDYWDLVSSGQREAIVSGLQEHLTDPVSLELLGTNAYYNDLLFYYDRISITLSTLAAGRVLDNFHQLRHFDYDIRNETLYRYNAVRFPNTRMSYSNLADDSKLDVDELRSLARYIVSGDKYLHYRTLAIESLQELDRRLASVLNDNLDDVHTTATQDLVLAVSVPLIVLVIFGFTCGVTVKRLTLFRLKKATFSCIALSSVCAVLVLGLSIFVQFQLNGIQNEFFLKEEITSDIVLLEGADQRLAYFAGSFTQFGSNVDYLTYFEVPEQFAPLTARVEDIVKNQGNLRTFYSYENLFSALETTRSSWQSVRQIELIALRIGAAGFNLSNYLVNYTKDVVWNVADEPDYHIQNEIYSYVPEESRYSNYEHDLSLEPEIQQSLARAVLFGPKYYHTSLELEAELTPLRDSFERRFLDIFSKMLSETLRNVLILIFSSILFGVSLLASTISFYLSLTPAKEESSHIKQRITVSLVSVLTKQYILSLTIIGIVLAVFYAIGFYFVNSTSYIAPELNLAGQRMSYTQEALTYMAHTIARPVDRELLRLHTLNTLDRLQATHHQLLFGNQQLSGSAGRYATQDSLEFITRFTGESTIDTGLSVHLESFIILARQFSTASQGITFRFDGYHFSEMYSLAEQLDNSMMNSLDVYRDEALQLLSGYLAIMRILFALFLVTLIIIFFAVFKRMIKRLKSEEAVTLTLLQTIPESVIAEVPLIADYLASRE